ncbi:MAG: FAD-dependent thymidylate synthase, partial [Armatimonadetes bacterium]|nr:FAD-dependent thymidylate synthase [Armatimonadota bacterium]
LAVYEDTIHSQFGAYHSLCERLMAPAARAYFERFPARARHPEKWQRDIERKAMEVARYVLPVATFTYLYHTISALTLLRYHRVCRLLDAPLEQQVVVGKMVDCLLAEAPEYERLLEEPIALEETAEYAYLSGARECGGMGVWGCGGTAHTHTPTHPHTHTPTHPPNPTRAFREEFDHDLGGRVSKLVGWKASNEAVLADSVREVLGLPRAALADDEAIRLALDPGRNPLLAQALNLSAHGKLTRCLAHPCYTFRKKLSHAADSQDQRHRTTPGSRPVLALHVDGEPDTVVPELVKRDEECARRYARSTARSWEGMAHLRRLGVSPEFALYLLPNAAAIRFTESADLLNLRHKHAMRLCYNAQEEIWRASVDEAQQIRAVDPRIGAFLLPPCTLRDLAGQRPICPEGARFCGLPVWKLDLAEYERVI